MSNCKIEHEEVVGKQLKFTLFYENGNKKIKIGNKFANWFEFGVNITILLGYKSLLSGIILDMQNIRFKLRFCVYKNCGFWGTHL